MGPALDWKDFLENISLKIGRDVSNAVSRIAIVGCATFLFCSDAALADIVGIASVTVTRTDSIFLFID